MRSGVAMLASIFFHRFDPAAICQKRAQSSFTVVTLPRFAVDPGRATARHICADAARSASEHAGFLLLVAAELAPDAQGAALVVVSVAAGLAVACIFAPFDAARGGVLVAAWLWPIFVWSPMGCREARHATESLIFSSARSIVATASCNLDRRSSCRGLRRSRRRR